MGCEPPKAEGPATDAAAVVVVVEDVVVVVEDVVVDDVVSPAGVTAAPAPQSSFVKPSFEPGREAGSFSRMSLRPFRSGCEWCPPLHAVHGMLMTTYGLESDPVRCQMITWWCASSERP